MMYLKGTQEHMLVYKHRDKLEVISYSNYDFGTCSDNKKILTLDSLLCQWEGISHNKTSNNLLLHPSLCKLNL